MIDSLKNQTYSNTHSSKWLITPLNFFVGFAWICRNLSWKHRVHVFLALFHDSKIPVARGPVRRTRRILKAFWSPKFLFNSMWWSTPDLSSTIATTDSCFFWGDYEFIARIRQWDENHPKSARNQQQPQNLTAEEWLLMVRYCWWFRNPKANHLGCC